MKYEKWSLGYWLLKQYVRFASWIILNRTIITGREKIPANKPIVFAPNHQNALSDPMAVLLNTGYQPVWLARADIFGKNKAIDTILKFLKIIPVYRLRDGKENLDKNQETFAISVKVLENNSALALFPEAAHTSKRQMIPHKKAVPRIVFMAEELTGNRLDIQIIPAGIYYSHYWKFNHSIIINFGDPIPVAEYLKIYQQNPNAATISLKSKIHDAILPLTLNINSKKHYNAFEYIRIMYGNHFMKRKNIKPSVLNQFHSDRELIDLLDSLEKKNPQKAEKVSCAAIELYHTINNNGLRPWLFDMNLNHYGKLMLNVMFLLLGFPLFLYGFALNAIPFFLIDRLVQKKIKDQSFWSSFFLVAGIILFPIYYFILFLFILPLTIPLWIKLVSIATLPFAGKLAFKWYLLMRKTTGILRYLKIKQFDKNRFCEIIASKNSFFDELDKVLGVN